MSQRYDAIVVGTGQSGPSLAVRLAGAGLRVAIIERGAFGGTCVNNGCIPTKTLVASAYVAHLARRAAEYGVETGPVRVDMQRVKARKDAIAGRSSQDVEQWLRGTANLTVRQGHARFIGSHAVRVGDDVLEAERLFINVGGRPLVPAMPGVDRVPFLTNVTMMDMDFLPEHLIVIGGSYIGLEFGQMYRRFGSRVTVVEKAPRLIAREDEDVSLAVQDILAADGVELRLNAECLATEPDGPGVAVTLGCEEGPPRVSGSHLLLAVGRVPNTDDLGLDQAGIRTDGRGYIVVDEELRTNVPGVWALGDCNGRGAFTHTSYNDYEIVADSLLNQAARKVGDRIVTYALFTDPPLGRVGLTETEARAAARRLLVGKRPMTRVGRAVEKGETQGFIKIVADADSQQILGAAVLGTDGDDAVQTLTDAMYARLPYTAVQRGVRIHPTVSELIPTVLGEMQPA
jgi:pyruvate/2-oxoglutarate dehydrogenase complex dihydrolipoamide dehydrogenase (E3) component